jgi:hypothetical protein
VLDVLDDFEVVAVLDVMDVVGDALVVLEFVLVEHYQQLVLAHLQYFLHLHFEDLDRV